MNLKKFSSKDSDFIAEATSKAELMTSGEIFTVLTRSCSDYRGYVLFFSSFAFLLATSLIILFSDDYLSLLQSFFWEIDLQTLIFVTAIFPMLVFIFFYLVFSIPALKYQLSSKSRMIKEVRLNAESAFFRHGITATEGATGVLIFISIFERRVEILVDYKIKQKIDNKVWEEVLSNIINGIKTDNFVQVLYDEIIHCGLILKNDFPRMEDDVDELSNKPVIE